MKFFSGALVFILGASILEAVEEKSGNAPTVSEIRDVLRAQQEAWNRGDIDSFMHGYARAETTVFVSGDEVTRGWQTVRDRYLKKYSDRAKMGTLTFSDLEIEQLGPDSAVALGRWELKRASDPPPQGSPPAWMPYGQEAGVADNPHGRFTLIFRKTPDGWRIVHDHTSAAAPPA